MTVLGIDKDMGQQGCPAGGNANWYNHFGKPLGNSYYS